MNRSPIFEKGRILKLEMLESLRDFPRDIVKIHTNGYANGILKGCSLSSNDGFIRISPGLICYDGRVYILKEGHEIKYRSSEDVSILKIRFTGEDRGKDFSNFGFEILIEECGQAGQNEIELCRFRLGEGFELRSDYRDFEDMQTEYNTMCIIDSPFSAYGGHTLSSEVFRRFATEAFSHNLSDPLDVSFCMACLNSDRPVEMELASCYVSSRLGIGRRSFSNREIYGYLNEILALIRDGGRLRSDSGYKSDYIYID